MVGLAAAFSAVILAATIATADTVPPTLALNGDKSGMSWLTNDGTKCDLIMVKNGITVVIGSNSAKLTIARYDHKQGFTNIHTIDIATVKNVSPDSKLLLDCLAAVPDPDSPLIDPD